MSSLEMDFAVAIFALGGMFGALPAGALADFIGRLVNVIRQEAI